MFTNFTIQISRASIQNSWTVKITTINKSDDIYFIGKIEKFSGCMTALSSINKQ